MDDKPKNDQSAIEAEVAEQNDSKEASFSEEEMQRNIQLAEEKSKLLEELTDRHKRLQADFDNFRRRSRIEKEELAQVVTESVVLKLLPVIDSFERARLAGPGQSAESVLEGIELIYRQFMTTLEKMDIHPIQAVGATFNPNLHEAVMSAPDDNNVDGTILEEFQRGYTLGSKAIRPSMVKVVTN